MKSMTFKEINAYYEDKAKRKVYCRCGHSMSLIPKADYKVCSHCGHRIYNDKGKSKLKMLKALGYENIDKYLVRESSTFKNNKKMEE
jgi:DNA-directed RNA polymerase subunit RPC12/RpoP